MSLPQVKKRQFNTKHRVWALGTTRCPSSAHAQADLHGDSCAVPGKRNHLGPSLSFTERGKGSLVPCQGFLDCLLSCGDKPWESRKNHPRREASKGSSSENTCRLFPQKSLGQTSSLLGGRGNTPYSSADAVGGWDCLSPDFVLFYSEGSENSPEKAGEGICDGFAQGAHKAYQEKT